MFLFIVRSILVSCFWVYVAASILCDVKRSGGNTSILKSSNKKIVTQNANAMNPGNEQKKIVSANKIQLIGKLITPMEFAYNL